MLLDTTTVSGRRQLHFDSLDDILADVDKLAQAKDVHALGNWSPGQLLQHLALAMDNSIDGRVPLLPWPLRVFLRLTMKRRFLDRPMAPGFRLPPRAAAILIPGATDFAAGLENLRLALGRLKTEDKRAVNAAIGPLTREEWDRLHCRHSELHLSFLLPET